MQMLAFTETNPRRGEPQKLRYRIFTIGAVLDRSGRRVLLHLSSRSPWAEMTLTELGHPANRVPG